MASWTTIGATTMAIATSLLVATASRADPATGVLSIRVLQLRSDDGQVGCTVYGSEKGYPTDSSLALQRRWCVIASRTSTCAFDPLPAGTYAVACFHDENKNGRLDTGVFGIPKEGTVASNQAKGFMGPPSFDKAKFAFRGIATELQLRMGY